VTYKDGGEVGIVRPDPILLADLADRSIDADIIDPYGTQFGDWIPKLNGFAKYAATYGETIRRIDAVAKEGESYRVLDLEKGTARAAAQSAISVEARHEDAVSDDDTV
jgi:hypothetical protein